MLKRLYAWYGKKTVWAVSAVVIILVLSGIVVAQNAQRNNDTAEEQLPVVRVDSVADIASEDSITLIGTIRAVSEAQLQSEVGGRITSVSVALGDFVQAGQVLGQQENASQRAAVLQAEGSYEATLASAEQSGVSLAQAQTNLVSTKNSAINTIQGAYTTVNNAFYLHIDNFYRTPNSPLTSPYFEDGNRKFLSSERVAFQDILPQWQTEVAQLSTDDNLSTAIATAIERVNRTKNLADIFVGIVQERDIESVNGLDRATVITNLNALRTSLDSTVTALKTAQTNLTNAENAVVQAQIGGGSQASSAASAQVKQALGSLRAAQANLEKTIFRTPIAGTVNSLSMHVGDYIGAFTTVAQVANNNALEISTFVGEVDLARITVGQTVRIENKFDGVVTHVAPGIDSVTQKSEVKIATETAELTNGDTVSISLSSSATQDQSEILLLPLTAIKFSAENGFVFTVEDQTLVSHEVQLGKLRGSFVEVTDGVSSDMVIVLDVRGLSEGGKVAVTN